ncbi:MAG: FAD-binding oxidoreductase [Hyphomonadaceae bacterium]|nr:FAD-binding oxidoreductase [Hyphomonadaceae bacterium]
MTAPDDLAPHLREWRGRGVGHTPFMALPETTQDLAFVVAQCAAAGVPMTTQGGNTGLVGGQIPQGEVLVSLKRLNRIRAVDVAGDAITVEAGVVLTTLHEAAAAHDRHFPLSLASQGSATIGGLISTNAGGVHVLRYGMMRDLVLGIEAVLPDGAVLHGLKALRKDNTGYDLKHLLIGGEGTLGVVTAATLRLFPRPRGHVVAMAALDSAEQAIDLLQTVRAETGALAAFEIMNSVSVAFATALPGVRAPFTAPWLALMEFESASETGLRDLVETTLGAAIAAGLATDAVVAQSVQAAQDFWKLRESIPAGHRAVGAPQTSHDTSTPVSAIPAFLKAADALVERLSPGARCVAFGHAGDGNIHYTAIAASAEAPFPAAAISAAIHDLAASFGGSISAEHGIGVFRRDELPRFKDPAALAMMRAVKQAIDPRGLMNPRAMLAHAAAPQDMGVSAP